MRSPASDDVCNDNALPQTSFQLFEGGPQLQSTNVFYGAVGQPGALSLPPYSTLLDSSS